MSFRYSLASVPEAPNEIRRVLSASVAIFDELDHFEPLFTRFRFGNLSVRTSDLLAEFTLGGTCIDAHPPRKIQEAIVSGRVE